MDKAENLSRRHSLFASAAALTPITQAASGESWPMVLGMAIAAYALGKWCSYGAGWVLAVQRVWGCLLISVLMKWSTLFWQDLPFCSAVPFVLLALAAWTVAVPGKARQIGCVLLWPLIFLLGAVLLPGVSEIQLSYLKPMWRLPSLILFPMLLLPNLGQAGKRDWKLPTAALGVCLVTTGVLSTAVSMSSPSGLYELSRSLSLLGMAERFESLIAAAMTMGLYAAISYLLEPPEEKERGRWIYPGLSAALYLLGPIENGWILSAGSLLIWLVLPGLNREKMFSQYGKKTVDD